MDPDSGEPLDDLTPAAVESLEELGCSCTKVSQVLETRDSAVYTAIQEGLDGANKEAISNAQKVSLCTPENPTSNHEISSFLFFRFKSSLSLGKTFQFLEVN